mmetsp:Transcript_28812/g.67047  ORF Transcript_28812/g.67047 Transcript_28812/m.67047 type:complete len:306 (+) Transcript_28812:1438-2355(+)
MMDGELEAETWIALQRSCQHCPACPDMVASSCWQRVGHGWCWLQIGWNPCCDHHQDSPPPAASGLPDLTRHLAHKPRRKVHCRLCSCRMSCLAWRDVFLLARRMAKTHSCCLGQEVVGFQQTTHPQMGDETVRALLDASLCCSHHQHSCAAVLPVAAAPSRSKVCFGFAVATDSAVLETKVLKPPSWHAPCLGSLWTLSVGSLLLPKTLPAAPLPATAQCREQCHHCRHHPQGASREMTCLRRSGNQQLRDGPALRRGGHPLVHELAVLQGEICRLDRPKTPLLHPPAVAVLCGWISTQTGLQAV